MTSKAVSQELSKIEKLNRANHSIWKRRICHILFQDKVEYVIDIGIPTPPPENSNASAKTMYEKHLEDDKTARNILLTFMETDIEILFKEYAHAKTMFDAITEAYRASSKTYIQLLIERFNGTMMNESDNVIEYVNKMSVIAKELVVLGNPIPNKMRVSTILHSLPDSWDSVVVALNYSATPVNMKNLPTLLGIEVERRNKKNTSKSLLTIASTSQPPKNETPKKDKKNFSKNFKGK